MKTFTLKSLTLIILSITSYHLNASAQPEVSRKDMNACYSPDSSKVAFTRGNDLWVRNIADSLETRLTFDGNDLILNGYASWVYYEEILGRASNYKAFWWSPDSQKIGFYRFDNSQVTMFPIFSPFGQNGSLSLTRYPKAGQQNPEVRVGIIDLFEQNTIWADFDSAADQYFGIPFWSADSREFYVANMPRRQSQLDLYAVNAADGSRRAVYHEEHPTWISWIEEMTFTDKGFYMIRDFETGWQQIYFLSFDGNLTRLSEGDNWDMSILRTDEKSGDIWFTAKRESRIHKALYRLDRKGRVTSLTDSEYNVAGVKFSEDGKTFTARLSTSRTPFFTVEGRSYGKKLAVAVQGEEAQAIPEGPVNEVVTIENDGWKLWGLMSRPQNFDPSRKYPVIMCVYGGPETAYVRDSWRNRDATNSWCWENGIIYIVVDPRSAGENGRKGTDEAFGRMTVIELQDYIAWAKWLQSLPYVQGDRIGVTGFSFGGTTTTMLTMRYPEYFHCGIAGGGVYDWNLYDSHYTERYMDTPQANPEGYKLATAMNYVEYAAKLRRGDTDEKQPVKINLMLTHGTGDDNVHFQNTLQLIDAFQRENIQFELMIYPDGMHGYRGYQHIHDSSCAQDFWTRMLLK